MHMFIAPHAHLWHSFVGIFCQCQVHNASRSGAPSYELWMASRSFSPIAATTMIVNVSAATFAILAIGSCLFDRLNNPAGRDRRVAAQNEDAAPAQPPAHRLDNETQRLLGAAREEDLTAFEHAIDGGAVFPHFKSGEVEEAFLGYRFQHGFPRLQQRINAFFSPVCYTVAGLLYVMTDVMAEMPGVYSNFSLVANTERRLALAAMLLATVPLWSGLRSYAAQSSIREGNFYLYANAVVTAFLVLVLVGGAIVVNASAYQKTSWDWMLRAIMTGLLLTVPRLGDISALSATAITAIFASATEIVCYVALEGAAYKCICYQTLSISIIGLPLFIYLFMYWILVTITACELYGCIRQM